MIDPDVAPYVHGRDQVDRTGDVRGALADPEERKVRITYAKGNKVFSYSHPNARLLENTERLELARDSALIVRGEYWLPPLNLYVYEDVFDSSCTWIRIVGDTAGKKAVDKRCPSEDISWISTAARTGQAFDIRKYWRRVTNLLPSDDPLRNAHEHMDSIHPDSAFSSIPTVL